MRATGAQLLTRVLVEAGVGTVAGIPGNTVASFAAAVADEERLFPLLVRNEAIASFAADVHYRVSGRLMAVMAHALPGATTILPGVANAYADSSAMIVILGEIARDALGRGAYQELSRGMDGDTAQLMRHAAKRVWQVNSPLQLVEHGLRAVKVAVSGRPGPTVLSVFHDVWDQEVDIPDWPSVTGYVPSAVPRPDSREIELAAQALAEAKRPLILAGNGVNLARAQAALLALAERLGAPVATTVTGKGAFPENHALSVGVIGWFGTKSANWAGQQADVVLAVGARLSEAATSSWQPHVSLNLGVARIIQADIDPVEIGTLYPVAVALPGDAQATLRDLERALPGTSRSEWREEVSQARADWQAVVRQDAESSAYPLSVGPVVASLRRQTAGQPVTIVCDVGKHLFWLIQQFEVDEGDMVVASMGGGTMGIGPCGAVGAAIGRPEAKTIAFVGDGGLSMTQYVLPTVAEYQLPVVYVVINDASYSTIANMQLQRYGKTFFSRFDGSGRNPGYELDFASLARSCGIAGKRVERVEQLDAAFEWALAQQGPALLDIVTDPASMIPPGGGSKLGDIWAHPIHPWARRPASDG